MLLDRYVVKDLLGLVHSLLVLDKRPAGPEIRSENRIKIVEIDEEAGKTTITRHDGTREIFYD